MSGEPLMAGTSEAQVGLTKALGFKEAGNALLKDGSFKQASFQYKQGLMHLKANLPSSGGEGDGMVSMFAAGRKAVVTEEETAAVRALAVVLNSNLAQARIKLLDWDGMPPLATHHTDTTRDAHELACCRTFFSIPSPQRAHTLAHCPNPTTPAILRSDTLC